MMAADGQIEHLLALTRHAPSWPPLPPSPRSANRPLGRFQDRLGTATLHNAASHAAKSCSLAVPAGCLDSAGSVQRAHPAAPGSAPTRRASAKPSRHGAFLATSSISLSRLSGNSSAWSSVCPHARSSGWPDAVWRFTGPRQIQAWFRLRIWY